MFLSVNPSDGEVIASYEPVSSAHAIELIKAVKEAQLNWSKRGYDSRAEIVSNVASLLREKADELAHLMAQEMGKVFSEGVGEAMKCAWVCQHYADNAEAMLAVDAIDTDASRSVVRYDPLGVVLAIMPWNFPLWQVMRFVAPALMAGNAVLIKHAPNTMGCSVAIADLVKSAGLPPNLLVHLPLEVDDVEAVLSHPMVSAVTFTGSTSAGRQVAAVAGQHGVPSVLELGGSDPFIVLADADIDAAVEAGLASRLLNAGQSCIAAKRMIVVEAVADEFITKLSNRLPDFVVGDPLDPASKLGPMARDDLRQGLHQQVQQSVQAGANLVLGGSLPEGPGFYYPVTLLTSVGPGMPAWDAELFGPVVAIRIVADEAAALDAANDTEFGLGAAIFTAQIDRAEEFATKIEAGCLFVNGMVKSDPRLPFGGVKSSGYGRELGPQGIMQFVNIRTVWVR